MTLFRLSLLALVLAAGCSGPPDRVAVPALAPEGAARIGFSSVEVRDLSLPAYAQGEEIHVQTAAGLIERQSGLIWADDPVRAGTLELVRGLDALTAARIAGEPWPFEDFPEARVEVRIEEFVASAATGAFRVSGQYFVADLTGGGRNRSDRFAIAVPLADTGPGAIAAARAQAMADLALLLAEGLR